MDVAFEVFIPADLEISKIGFTKKLFEWEGVAYPQEPEELRFHFFRIIKSDVPQYIISSLPPALQEEDWQCLSINEGLEELQEGLLNSETESENRKILLQLLATLTLGQDKWVINIEPGHDSLAAAVKGDLMDTSDAICRFLMADEKESFLIWSW